MFLHEPFQTITYYSIFKNRNLVILISNVILWIFYYGHILSVKTYLAEFWAAKDYLQIYLPWSWAWSSFWLLAVEYPFLYLQDLHRQFPLMKICFSAIAQQCQWRCGHPQKMDKARCFVWWLPFCGSIVQHPYVKHRNLGHFFCDGVHSNPLGNYVFRK